MKNRSQPFDCSIAAKTVGISLRHGGGLQEPETVYVRCDERDCQYVDLNQSPCPLRIDMFADASDGRVAEHLTAHAGERQCYACLTETLDITHDQVRRASWRLKDVEGFSIRPSRCVTCQRRRVTIGLSRRDGQRPPLTDVAAATPLDGATHSPAENGAASIADETVRALGERLRAHAGYAFCAHCLARELKLSPSAVRDAMWKLDPHDAFRIRTGQCVSCLLTKRVIQYNEPPKESDHAVRIIKFLVESPGLAYCAACVAFAADVGLADAKRLLGYLDAVAQFHRREAPCAACGRWQANIGFIGSDADAPRLAEVADVLSGHTRYRAFRIDLLSFRTGEGWRPFALVKGPTGALAPEALPIVMDLTPTKIEADELAGLRAREWIDKRVP